MGKLKDLIQEETLADRLVDRANRVRLAGLGLIKRVEREGNKLLDELVEAGHGDVADTRLTKRIDAVGRGAVIRVREEAKKIFEELVALGEASSKPKSTSQNSNIAEQSVVEYAKNETNAKVAVAKSAEPAAVNAAVNVAEEAAAPVAEVVSETTLAAFKSAQARVKTLKSAPDAATLANLYALYKQASGGDVTGKRPGLTEPVERAKFDARKKLKGLSANEAIQQYIELVDSLVGAYA